MNPKEPISPSHEPLELDLENMSTVDDFIKELEAKERDLHITADLTIEVEESDVGKNVPKSVVEDVQETAPNAVHTTESQPGPKTRIYDLEQEVTRLSEKLAGLRADRNDIQEKSDRRLKDFENYKYRVDRERRGAFIDQICNLAGQMLPILDNFERALDSVGRFEREKSPEFEQFYDGIVLVHQQMNEVLTGMGVEPIKTVGEIFDPNFHEAVAAESRSDMPHNTILEEMLRGHRIGNRVIRHSMVRVSSSPNYAKAARPAPVTTAVDLDPDDNGILEALPPTR
jgi:molecular chaperone GrpE